MITRVFAGFNAFMFFFGNFPAARLVRSMKLRAILLARITDVPRSRLVATAQGAAA